MDDPVTSWEDDFAVPWWAKPVIRRALRRVDRDLRSARRSSVDADDLATRIGWAGRRFSRTVTATDRLGGWVETANRDDLYEAVAELVRRTMTGYRGDLDALVQAAWDGIEEARDW